MQLYPIRCSRQNTADYFPKSRYRLRHNSDRAYRFLFLFVFFPTLLLSRCFDCRCLDRLRHCKVPLTSFLFLLVFSFLLVRFYWDTWNEVFLSCHCFFFLSAYDVAGNRSRRGASQEAVLSNGPLVGGFCFGRLCSFLYGWMMSLLEMDLAERETWFWYGEAGVSSHVFIPGRAKGQCKR